MKPTRAFLRQASPLRALIEAWLACAGLLLPLLPVMLETTPLARSLYLVILPLVCAAVAGLRMRSLRFVGPLRSAETFSASAPGGGAPAARAALKECGLALALGLGVLGIVIGLLAGLSRLDSIRYSYAGTWGTIFFLSMSAPEYLGVRMASWALRRWERLRRGQYVWALTHAILRVVGGVGLLVLIAAVIFLAQKLGGDIWQIPPGSPFALTVFWLSMVLFLAFVLLVTGAVLLLPPILLFSYLVARKMTARLENLAAVTRSLRQGNLAARVGVEGEDEIAQLQVNFNAMAADQEKSVQALQTEKDRVWELLDARRELVAGISHELRNPVAIIQGYSESLRCAWKERTPEEIDRDLQALQNEAARLQAILNDLLAAAQLEAGCLRVTIKAVDVVVLARRLVDTFSALAWDSKRIQVTLSAPEPGIFALADPLRLEQVLVNLVQNALRHTSPGGLVALEIHPGPEGICIEVEDTGEGIPPEDLPHIWEKYYQSGDPSRRTSYSIGLGLSLVKELIEAMGGTVSVESCPGQGSLFQVRLPT